MRYAALLLPCLLGLAGCIAVAEQPTPARTTTYVVPATTSTTYTTPTATTTVVRTP